MKKQDGPVADPGVIGEREARSGRTRARRVDGGQARELRILNAIAEALNSTLDLQQALERTLVLVTDLLGLHTGWIWLLDPETGRFYIAAVHNLPPYLQAPVQMTGKSCWCIREFQEGSLTPKNIGVLECSRLRGAVSADDRAATTGLRYHACLPLLFRDTPLGIMNVTGPSWRKLTQVELRLLSTITYQLGIAIERARLAQESTRLARAEERTRLAREIHDTLAQGLTAIALHIEGALPHLEQDPARARVRLERALEATRESLEEARRSVLNLRTGLPAGGSLAETLGALSRRYTAETGIRVYLNLLGERAIPLAIESELFRIAQEALANVRAHASAHEVTIALRISERAVSLSIQDDGQGFDPRAVGQGHHGIIGMRERAALVGGRLRVRSRAGAGTTVLAAVPFVSEQRR